MVISLESICLFFLMFSVVTLSFSSPLLTRLSFDYYSDNSFERED